MNTLTPYAVTTSSVSSNPPHYGTGVLSQDTAIWHSAVNTGNSEWLRFQFTNDESVTSLYCEFVWGRDGSNARLEGSDDGTAWTNLLNFDRSRYEDQGSGYASYSATVVTSESFRYFRVMSNPAPYLAYRFIQLYGTRILVCPYK